MTPDDITINIAWWFPLFALYHHFCWWNPSEFPNFHQVLKGWVGEEKGFDPLGVTDALPVYWVREAEPRVMDMNGIFKEYWNDWNVNGTSLKNGALNGKIRVLLLCFILYTWWFNWCGNGIVMGYSRSSNGILMRYSWDAESFTFWHVDCHVHVQCIWRERKRERERETESDKRTLREREKRLLDI